MRPTINLRLDPEQILPVGGVTGGCNYFRSYRTKTKIEGTMVSSKYGHLSAKLRVADKKACVW